MDGNIEYVVVNTTVDGEEKAKELAGLLVREKLAACVHRWPIQSVYMWKGAVESEPEQVLAAKTRKALVAEVIDFIKKHHPYEVPEIIVTPVIDGLRGYLDWVRAETREPR